MKLKLIILVIWVGGCSSDAINPSTCSSDLSVPMSACLSKIAAIGIARQRAVANVMETHYCHKGGTITGKDISANACRCLGTKIRYSGCGK